jgi:hypothetical protein
MHHARSDMQADGSGNRPARRLALHRNPSFRERLTAGLVVLFSDLKNALWVHDQGPSDQPNGGTLRISPGRTHLPQKLTNSSIGKHARLNARPLPVQTRNWQQEMQ